MIKIFNSLTEEEKRKFKFQIYKEDEPLFFEHEICDYVGFVNKGLVRIVSSNQNGKEIEFANITKGGIFGNNLVFSSEPTFKADVYATAGSELYFINKKDLLTLFKNEKFLTWFLKIEADSAKLLNFKIRLLSLNSIKEKLIYYLKENNGITNVSVSSIALTLNVSREALSREISSMIKSKILSKKQKTIKLIKEL